MTPCDWQWLKISHQKTDFLQLNVKDFQKVTHGFVHFRQWNFVRGRHVENIAQLNKGTYDCVSFARRTFTNPKIRTFATSKFGHLPPLKTIHLPGGQLPPPIFLLLFLAHFFLAFSTYSSWRTSRMGRRRCLMRWSWSTSSRRCVTRWSWSTSSRRWLSWWSWRTSRRRKGRLSFMFLFMAAWITHF